VLVVCIVCVALRTFIFVNSEADSSTASGCDLIFFSSFALTLLCAAAADEPKSVSSTLLFFLAGCCFVKDPFDEGFFLTVIIKVQSG